MSGKYSILVGEFTERRSNTLAGIVDIVIPELRLKIRELSVHERDGKRWVGLPARPQIDQDGRVRLNDRGKRLYVPIMQFLDRPTADAFSTRVIEVLLHAYPRAFRWRQRGRGGGIVRRRRPLPGLSLEAC